MKLMKGVRIAALLAVAAMLAACVRATPTPTSTLEYRIAFESDRPHRGSYMRIWVMDGDGSNPRPVVSGEHDRSYYDCCPAWSPDGSAIAFKSDYVTGAWTGETYAFIADATSGELTTITSSALSGSNTFCTGPPSWSSSDSRIACACNFEGTPEICITDEAGADMVNITNEPASYGDPVWSLDGSRIAFTIIGDGGGLFVMDADGANLTRLNDIGGMDIAWSPDGSRIAFVNIVDEPEGLPGIWTNKEIFVIDADGSNLTRLTDHPAWDEHPAWSPDGSLIAFQTRRDELPNDNNSEVYVMDTDGSNVTRLTNHPAPDDYPAWSPDGSRIAFMSHRDGNWEIYVMDADGSNIANLTNDPNSDMYPVWSPNSEPRE